MFNRTDYMKAKNRQNYLKAKIERRDFVRSFKYVPCKDCNRQFNSWQMQFDHLRDKKFELSRSGIINSCGKQRLLEEINKCEIVCANCHADRTFKRTNRWYNLFEDKHLGV